MVLLVLWAGKIRRQARYLGDVQAMAQDVAQKFWPTHHQHTTSGIFGKLCWDMNDMLDQLEACFREQATALHYASAGQSCRLAQPVGLRGTFAESLSRTGSHSKTWKRNIG